MNEKLDIAVVKLAVNQLVDFVKPTYGPNARKVIIADGNRVLVLDDGVSIAHEFHLQGKADDAILNLVKEVAKKTNDRVGDGTTGSLILLQSILEHNISVEDLKKGMAEAKEKLLEEKHLVDTEEELFSISKMAYNNEEVAKMISHMIFMLGPDAVVTLEESQGLTTEYEVKKGLQIDTGFSSPYMITNFDTLEAEWTDTPIFITDRKIRNAAEILPLVDVLIKQGISQMVMIANDFEGDVLPSIVNNILKNGFKILALKAPHFADRQTDVLGDVAAATGGEIFSQHSTDSVAQAKIGFAHKVIATKDTTTIVASETETPDLGNRISQIKHRLESEKSEFDRHILEKRLGRLTGGVAVIKVGANTQSEMKDMKYKIEDSVNATKVAMKS